MVSAPKISYRQGQSWNSEILASSPHLSTVSHEPKTKFVFAVYKQYGKWTLCLFLQSENCSCPFSHLSISTRFYLRLAPEAFHVSHLHICALTCVQTLQAAILLSRTTSLVFLSFPVGFFFFFTYQPFFLVN